MEQWIDSEGGCWNGENDATLTDEEKKCVNEIYEQLMYQQDERISKNQLLEDFDEERGIELGDVSTEGNKNKE